MAFLLDFFSPSLLFVFLLPSVSVSHWQMRQGGQFDVLSGAERRPRPPGLMSCEILLQARLQTVSQVCRACRNVHLWPSHIFFLSDSQKKKNLINSRSQQKRIIAHLWHYRIVSALLIDSRGSRESGSGLALKTTDPDADRDCRNMRESWKMRMFQPEKLLPWCKFNRPTRKREQRLL